MRRAAAAMVLFGSAVFIGGCGTARQADAGATSKPPPATLLVRQHTGARAGNLPAHAVRVEVDGQRHEISGNGDSRIELLPGPHALVVIYGPCFHTKTQLLPKDAPRELQRPRGEITFEAEAGATYTLGCSPGGGGAMIANAHWIDQQLPGGKRKRVADTSAGSDFPKELLTAEPPPAQTRPR